jgi:hypothetical protein
MSTAVEKAIAYAHTLIGLPYRWYMGAGELITGNDKFYAADEPAPAASELRAGDKSIVCTGVANLMRRHVGLPVPPAAAAAGIPYPGTTDAWFHYLERAGKLQAFDIGAARDGKYPAGSLLLRNFSDVETDQGHVAVLVNSRQLLHAYAHSATPCPGNDGECAITSLEVSHYYFGPAGYYTHICLADDWLCCPKN